MDIYKSAYQIAHGLLAKYKKRDDVTTEIIEKEISNIYLMPGFDTVDKEELLAQLESDFGVRDPKATQLTDDVEPWLYKTQIDYKYWSRYESLIRVEKPSFPIIGLDDKTNQILDNCMNPKTSGSWASKGMVVGNVQSGKTANYIGLVNKALDAGYKLVVVFAGIHNTLRAQTQDRIDEGIIGRKSVDLIQKRPTNKYGVGYFSKENTKPIYAYTSTPYFVREGAKAMKHGDFDINKARELNVPIDGDSPTILVIKKNKAILENLITWLAPFCNSNIDGVNKISGIPLFVIDDEADNASVNSGDKYDIKTINKLIRTLINLFNQSTFIGYTATPYANLFIPEDWVEEQMVNIKGHNFQIGPDIFPRNFIVNIHPPSNYVGALNIFGFENPITGEIKEPLDLIRIVNDQEPCFPTKLNSNNKDNIPEDIFDLPYSLKEAVKSFILSCAIREVRGQTKKDNSMLIHVARYVKWIDRVASIVNELMYDYKNQIKSKQGFLLEELKQLFLTDFEPTTIDVKQNLNYTDPKISTCSWSDVEKRLRFVAERIKVKAVHGSKKGLEYEDYGDINYNDYDEGLYVIAVGGDKLARGLTLEGLTISYFLRTSRMYDALMQMGRWFGYRPGYVDLCRLYTTEEIRLWYRHITMATEDMRADFDEMVQYKMKPYEYQLKVMSHPGMLSITSANKMREHTKLTVGYSGKLIQTYSFSKSNEYLQNNWNSFNSFIKQLASPKKNRVSNRIKDLFWENINSKFIIEFINSYMSDQPLRLDTITSYIVLQNNTGKLLDWDVSIIANSRKTVIVKRISNTESVDVYTKKLICEDIEIGLPVRNMIDVGNHIEVGGNKMAILDKHARMIGLGIDDSQLKEKEIENRRAELGRPLLVIYPIDPRVIQNNDIPILGWGIVFPKFENENKVEYALRPIPDLFENPHETDEEEDEE
ncbi:Z1 domain-containing protein [Saccharicrinis sp. FJH62]|uniref:Z1 domain-containing protein n=1 Tax=Saccharicrinis sp. FJH62 TaxID=3344657 RepID=UPI0035D4EF59